MMGFTYILYDNKSGLPCELLYRSPLSLVQKAILLLLCFIFVHMYKYKTTSFFLFLFFIFFFFYFLFFSFFHEKGKKQ